MKIVIVSGGTGGHIYPGLAIAQEIKRRESAAQILFMGSREGLESELIDGVKLIYARALLRKISYKAITAPFVSLLGFIQAVFILNKNRPKLVFSTGGYASLPVALAARLLGIPFILHEQNVLPGAVNRLCSKFARKIFLSFPRTLKYLQGEVVGNPVRREIREAGREAARKRLGFAPNDKVVLVVGGSQGAKRINETVVGSLAMLPSGVQVLHIIGQRDFNWIEKQIAGRQISNYHPYSYLRNMADVLAAADLAVSRAGATAISEFLIRGTPMVLVPFPFSAEGHQRLNARAIADGGGAIIVEDKDFTPGKFIELITDSGLDYDKMGQACRRLSRPDAAERIVDYIYA
ncbi:undecaprenyldiphospho-muramoylpentapeptide beta-N-acetylglucosaminyltransferase [Candidatus Margulisiibacteriota bacterium]